MRRGVQYMHCVMHKCIIVKLGGNEKHMKYVKKTRKFYEIRGKFEEVGEIIIFPKYGGNVLKPRKWEGDSKFVVND